MKKLFNSDVKSDNKTNILREKLHLELNNLIINYVIQKYINKKVYFDTHLFNTEIKLLLDACKSFDLGYFCEKDPSKIQNSVVIYSGDRQKNYDVDKSGEFNSDLLKIINYIHKTPPSILEYEIKTNKLEEMLKIDFNSNIKSNRYRLLYIIRELYPHLLL